MSKQIFSPLIQVLIYICYCRQKINKSKYASCDTEVARAKQLDIFDLTILG